LGYDVPLLDGDGFVEDRDHALRRQFVLGELDGLGANRVEKQRARDGQQK
jgi:hypothetical protein